MTNSSSRCAHTVAHLLATGCLATTFSPGSALRILLGRSGRWLHFQRTMLRPSFWWRRTTTKTRSWMSTPSSTSSRAG